MLSGTNAISTLCSHFHVWSGHGRSLDLSSIGSLVQKWREEAEATTEALTPHLHDDQLQEG
jgi:hypothetical protein